jgi:hypothetical protein
VPIAEETSTNHGGPEAAFSSVGSPQYLYTRVNARLDRNVGIGYAGALKHAKVCCDTSTKQLHVMFGVGHSTKRMMHVDVDQCLEYMFCSHYSILHLTSRSDPGPCSLPTADTDSHHEK